MLGFTLPPSGNSVPLQRLLAGDARSISPLPFGAALAARWGLPSEAVLPAGSGTSALWALLRGLSQADDRRAVAVPAWCCPSVPEAVLEAGLRPIPVDMDPYTMGYDPHALREARREGLLAVLLVHYFGIPQEIPPGDWDGTAFVRDCAQDFDHRPADGLPCIYSFGRGKALNAGHGGALCIPEDGPLRRACVHALASLPERGGDPRPMALAINALSEPHLYWAVSHLPGLGLGRTAWESPLRLERMSRRFDGVGLASLEAYASCRANYRRLVDAYRRAFSACDPASAWVPGPRAGNPWAPGPSAVVGGRLPVRFPVLARDPDLRAALLDGLGGRFGGVTRMYPSILGELPGAPAWIGGGTGFPGARQVAREILALPVTAALKGHEKAFFACLAGILESAGAPAEPAPAPEALVEDWSAVPAPEEGEPAFAGEEDRPI